MSLFKHLAALIAKGVDVQIAVSAADNGKLEVAFLPTSSSGKSGLNLVAKSFVGTPDELDADFSTVVAGYASVNATLADQLAAIQAEADAIADQAKATAKASAKAPTKTVSSVAKLVVPQKKSIAASASNDVLDGGDPDDAEDDASCSDDDSCCPGSDAMAVADDGQVTFTL